MLTDVDAIAQVMLLMERVSEAQRHAAMEMRSKDGRRGKGGRRERDAADDGEAQPELQQMIEQAGRSGKKRKG